MTRDTAGVAPGRPWSIELVDHGLGVAGRSPFADDPRFEERWWNTYDWPGHDRLNLSAYLGTIEVARIVLDDDIELRHYPGFPLLGAAGLEIEFFEVADDTRHQGVGSRVVDALGNRFPGRRLVALSEEADEFWASLGWQRFNGPHERFRVAFLAPAPTAEVS